MWKYASVSWNTYMGIIYTDVRTGLYPGQVKIGELESVLAKAKVGSGEDRR